MNQQVQRQRELRETDKVYILILAGGMGARIIQTCFIRSLIRIRKLEKNTYPILVVDNSIIGHMVSGAMSGQNVHGIQIPESPQQWPHDPGVIPIDNNNFEHGIYLDSWRAQNQFFNRDENIMPKLIKNNIDRVYSIEYGFSLTKLITQHRYKNDPKSFICNLYSKAMASPLEYDGGYPLLKMDNNNPQITKLINNSKKPIVLVHLGVDRNPHELMSGINYRTHKVWSLQQWGDLATKLKDKYTFIQVYANEYNPEVKNIQSIKVDNLNPVLQILQSPKCRMFISIDNYLPHLAASLYPSIKRRGIVLWGSVSPYVWGWKHNINIWNQNSCDQNDLGCWRPNMFDQDRNGKLWVCPSYSCMKSITVQQVINSMTKLDQLITKDKTQQKNTVTL